MERMQQRKILDYAVGYKEFNEAERSIVHYITTPDRDRGGDIVNPFGMLDKDFSKSPTVFYNHRYMLPVAKSLWRKAEDKGVLAKTQFSSVEYAQDVYRLHKEGIINTWSIGFRIPRNPDAVKYDEASKTLFINLWELIEYSSAPVAMNPNCLDVEKYEPQINGIERINMIKSFCQSEEMPQRA
jgi:HK97 family phage prohead protease